MATKKPTKPLTKNQQKTLKELYLRDMQWLKEKEQIKRAKEPKSSSRKA